MYRLWILPLTESVTYAGQLIAMVTLAPLADWKGRRVTIFLSCVIAVGANLIGAQSDR